MEKNSTLSFDVNSGIIVLMGGINMLSYFFLPNRIAYHFNFLGQAQFYGPTICVLMVMPALAALVVFAAHCVKVAPWTHHTQQSHKAFQNMVVHLVLLVFCLNAFLVGMGFGVTTYLGNIFVNCMLGSTVISLGLSLRKISPNFFLSAGAFWYGVLSSSQQQELHSATSWVWRGGGLMMMVSCLLNQGVRVSIGIGAILFIFPYIYHLYLISQKDVHH
jgi:hypothetical protein